MSSFWAAKKNKMGDTRKLSCAKCGLYRNSKNPQREPEGVAGADVLLIGEFVTEADDRRNGFWKDKSNKNLHQIMSDLGLTVSDDCLSTMAVACSTPDDRPPSDFEIDCCRRRLFKVIRSNKPKLIVLLGVAAVRAYFRHRTKTSIGMAKWRGWVIPDQENNCWVAPVFAPQHVYSKSRYAEIKTIWKQDLRRAIKSVDNELPPYYDPVKCVEIVSPSNVKALLKDILRKPGLYSFDYETTGLKPHADGHKIICVSICGADDKVYAFMFPEDGPELRLWRRVLSSTKILKTAHNLKCEHAWSFVRAGVEVNGWQWCSMQAAHVLDNRQGVCGLKFNALIHFGVGDYDSHISHYLKSDNSKNGNGKNIIEKLVQTANGRKELLTYCGIDSLVGRWLTLKQMKEFGCKFDQQI